MEDCLTILYGFSDMSTIKSLMFSNKFFYNNIIKNWDIIQKRFKDKTFLKNDIKLHLYQLRSLESNIDILPGYQEKTPILMRLKYSENNLLFCDKNSMNGWKNEINKNFPKMKYITFKKKEDLCYGNNLILISYDKLNYYKEIKNFNCNTLISTDTYKINNGYYSLISKNFNELEYKNLLSINNINNIIPYNRPQEKRFFLDIKEIEKKLKHIIKINKKTIIVYAGLMEYKLLSEILANENIIIDSDKGFIDKFQNEKDSVVLLVRWRFLLSTIDLSSSNCIVFLQQHKKIEKKKKLLMSCINRHNQINNFIKVYIFT